MYEAEYSSEVVRRNFTTVRDILGSHNRDEITEVDEWAELYDEIYGRVSELEENIHVDIDYIGDLLSYLPTEKSNESENEESLPLKGGEFTLPDPNESKQMREERVVFTDPEEVARYIELIETELLEEFYRLSCEAVGENDEELLFSEKTLNDLKQYKGEFRQKAGGFIPESEVEDFDELVEIFVEDQTHYFDNIEELVPENRTTEIEDKIFTGYSLPNDLNQNFEEMAAGKIAKKFGFRPELDDLSDIENKMTAWIIKYHPDNHGTAEEFQAVKTARDIIRREKEERIEETR